MARSPECVGVWPTSLGKDYALRESNLYLGCIRNKQINSFREKRQRIKDENVNGGDFPLSGSRVILIFNFVIQKETVI